MLCQPIIGVIIADGSIVEIGYYAVTADHLPQLRSVLDKFVDVLGYHDVVADRQLVTQVLRDVCSGTEAAAGVDDSSQTGSVYKPGSVAQAIDDAYAKFGSPY